MSSAEADVSGSTSTDAVIPPVQLHNILSPAEHIRFFLLSGPRLCETLLGMDTSCVTQVHPGQRTLNSPLIMACKPIVCFGLSTAWQTDRAVHPVRHPLP